jgi:lipid-binding SYLF domain-containing protein
MLKAVLVAGITSVVAFGWKEPKPERRLKDAAETFQEIMRVPDKTIPKTLLDRAECVIIVPGMIKAAITIGGEYGRGFVSCRTDRGRWGPPAALRLSGGSFGTQLGVVAIDVVMLVMNKRGVERLLSDKFTIGAEAAAAAGPVGREASADTDLLMTAEILSWSRSRGVFARVSLNGTVVRIDRTDNAKLYGKALTVKDILEGTTPIPSSAEVLTSVLEKYAPQPDRSRTAGIR